MLEPSCASLVRVVRVLYDVAGDSTNTNRIVKKRTPLRVSVLPQAFLAASLRSILDPI
jgi:hypothetical protein